MGYFPNGSSQLDYEETYCYKCIHCPVKEDDPGCAVMNAHFLFNYEFCNNKQNPLDVLIPKTENGLGNKQCEMFLDKNVSKACSRCKGSRYANVLRTDGTYNLETCPVCKGNGEVE